MLLPQCIKRNVGELDICWSSKLQLAMNLGASKETKDKNERIEKTLKKQ